MAECGPAAALYLHKRDESILLHHEVYFLAEKAKVAVEDSPTPLLQEGFGQRFETASATYGVQKMKGVCFGLGGGGERLPLASLGWKGAAMVGGAIMEGCRELKTL